MRGTRKLVGIAKAAAALIVTAATVVYLVQALSASWSEFTTLIAVPTALYTAGWLSIAYGACFFILFGSWYLTLRRNAPVRVPAGHGAFIYCIANTAKYLPGNVFHFAGRQILGTRAGWGHRAIAQATLLEIAAIVASILLIVLVTAGFGPDGAIESIIPDTWRPVAAYRQPAALAGLAGGGLTFFVFTRLGLFERLFGVPAAAVVRAITMCAAFFCLYATLAMIFAQCLPTGSSRPPMFAIGLAYLIAWLAGFVVPGAPGGLGVRESALVLLLSGGGDSGAFALGLGLGMRVVSTLGDVVAAGVAYGLDRSATRPRTHLATGTGARDG